MVQTKTFPIALYGVFFVYVAMLYAPQNIRPESFEVTMKKIFRIGLVLSLSAVLRPMFPLSLNELVCVVGMLSLAGPSASHLICLLYLLGVRV